MVPISVVRARAVLLACVAVSVAAAGCVASKDEPPKAEVLADHERASAGNDEQFTFQVARGTDKIVITAETSPESSGGFPGCEFCSPFANPGGQDGPEGHVEVEIVDPEGDRQAVFTLGFDSESRHPIDDPVPGLWVVDLEYESGYDGPMRVRVVDQAGASASRPFITDNLLEIIGFLLTVGGLVTAAVLYRRRGRFLRRELEKIDSTVHLFKDDVDECRTNLLELHEHLKRLLVKRKIEDSHYLILEKRIERYMQDLATPGNRHADFGAVAGTAAGSGPASRRKPHIVEEPPEWETL